MHITRYLLGLRLLWAVRIYELHPESCSVKAVSWLRSAGSAMSVESIAALRPRLQRQSGKKKSGRSSFGSLSFPPASQLMPCKPWVQQTVWKVWIARQLASATESAIQTSIWCWLFISKKTMSFHFAHIHFFVHLWLSMSTFSCYCKWHLICHYPVTSSYLCVWKVLAFFFFVCSFIYPDSFPLFLLDFINAFIQNTVISLYSLHI